MHVHTVIETIQYLTLGHFTFFYSDTATTEIYTLSLHDALPISRPGGRSRNRCSSRWRRRCRRRVLLPNRGRRPSVEDRKSTRLNSSHPSISYAVFCLKKKNNF